MRLFDFNRLIEAFNGFVETKVELWKIEAKEEISALIAKMLVVMLVALGAVMTLLFFTLALAYLLNGLLESNIWGFVIVGSIYALITIGLFVKRSIIIETVVRKQNEEIEQASEEDGL